MKFRVNSRRQNVATVGTSRPTMVFCMAVATFEPAVRTDHLKEARGEGLVGAPRVGKRADSALRGGLGFLWVQALVPGRPRVHVLAAALREVEECVKPARKEPPAVPLVAEAEVHQARESGLKNMPCANAEAH